MQTWTRCALAVALMVTGCSWGGAQGPVPDIPPYSLQDHFADPPRPNDPWAIGERVDGKFVPFETTKRATGDGLVFEGPHVMAESVKDLLRNLNSQPYAVYNTSAQDKNLNQNANAEGPFRCMARGRSVCVFPQSIRPIVVRFTVPLGASPEVSVVVRQLLNGGTPEVDAVGADGAQLHGGVGAQLSLLHGGDPGQRERLPGWGTLRIDDYHWLATRDWTPCGFSLARKLLQGDVLELTVDSGPKGHMSYDMAPVEFTVKYRL